jgi:hypothetical protein
VPAALKVTPQRLNLGSIKFSQGKVSGSQKVTLKNQSDSTAITLTDIFTSGDFSMATNCGATISPKEACWVKVRFTPTGYGERLGTLTIDSNASDPSMSVDLKGKAAQLSSGATE